MDLQALYQSITSFWDNISPILIAHVVFLFSWVWISKNSFDVLRWIESFLESTRFKRWKKIFDKFSFTSTIPYILLILILVYLSILSSALEFIAGGFSPLSIVYTETDFWLESYDGSSTSQLWELASYQPNPNANISDIYNFKTITLEQYKTKYPDQYKSSTDWINKLFVLWQKYYQLTIILIMIYGILLIIEAGKKFHNIKFGRLLVVFFIMLMASATTRLIAEHYIEKRLAAELNFAVEMLKSDGNVILDQQQISQVSCIIYGDRVHFYEDGADRFWLSRIVENKIPKGVYWFPRVFKGDPMSGDLVPRGCIPF